MKNKLIVTIGLPASGKSTWAKEQVESSKGKIKRINKDNLRSMIDSGKWSKEREKGILDIRNSLIDYWLVEGYSVIVDDTNFAPSHKNYLEDVAKRYNVDFEIKDFTNVSITECIKRDLARENSVGEKVISQMYFKYIFNKQNWTIPIKGSTSNAIIVDLDGTLAVNKNNNRHFDSKRYLEDGFNYHLWYLIKDQNVIFLSGREGTAEGRKNTIEWLLKYTGLTVDSLMGRLFMREEGDNREDSIIKAEIYDEIIDPYYNIIAVYDDRQKVIDMWRAKELFVCQVNYGDF